MSLLSSERVIPVALLERVNEAFTDRYMVEGRLLLLLQIALTKSFGYVILVEYVGFFPI